MTQLAISFWRVRAENGEFELRTFLVIIFISLTSLAESAPLRVTITEGVIEPLPYAAPEFIGETGASNELAIKITELVKRTYQVLGYFEKCLSHLIYLALITLVLLFNTRTGKL